MANHIALTMAIVFSLLSLAAASSEVGEGTNWAVLVAGSNGWYNYRHQADICHAYQILKKGGLKDENIIVLMYDDIAYNSDNPKKGVIVNSPKGSNVYPGVPKDYTGENVTASNLLAVILGNEKGVIGGSGKVVKSGPDDHIFIYYSDHGAPGLLSMPAGDDLYAKDFIEILKKKHASGTYKSMVVYVEACEAGSIFDGLLPEGLNIYATTASNPSESSYATYCPDEDSTVSSEYDTCLGDLYSVSWMEDSDKQNPQKETLQKQYEVVKNRTANAGDYSSHVMQYGDLSLTSNFISLYMGATNSKIQDYAAYIEGQLASSTHTVSGFDQREADLAYLRNKWRVAPKGSKEKDEAREKMNIEILHRQHIDASIKAIGELLFGAQNGAEVLSVVRPAGKPLVDDWDCLKTTVDTYRKYCGELSNYGKKYMRAFANICNSRVKEDQMAHAFSQACI